MTLPVQVIERNGQPEWAVLPYDEYLRLREQAEMLQDIQAYDQAKSALESGDEEVIPASVVDALLEGQNPLRVWREYRQLTQQAVAKKVGISVPYLSQLEGEQRKPSTRVLKLLAYSLGVSMDHLISNS
jgi:DNA-binding XRE family transcriptional regulator